MIKFDYKFLKIYKKIRQKGEEDETMVRDHQKCHHVVANEMTKLRKEWGLKYPKEIW